MTKRQERRLHYLMSVLPSIPRSLVEIIEKKNWKACPHYGNLKLYKELFRLFDKKQFTPEQAHNYWIAYRSVRRSEHHVYNQHPARPRKDNKDTINYGSGGGNRGSIRYPKKTRKTAWKRFYRLFPWLLSNNSTKD